LRLTGYIDIATINRGDTATIVVGARGAESLGPHRRATGVELAGKDVRGATAGRTELTPEIKVAGSVGRDVATNESVEAALNLAPKEFAVSVVRVVSSCLQNRLFLEYRLYKVNPKAAPNRI